MKKIGVIILCTILLVSLKAIGEEDCVKKETICPQTYETNNCNKFLCSKSDIETIFYETGLSDSQICTARKLQEKYEQETLSVNDRLTYEQNVLNEYYKTCVKNSDIRKQKRKIKNLNKTKKDICKCYEKQFKVMLSDAQRKVYNKYK